MRTYLDHLSIERGLAGNTLSSYRRDLRRYASFLSTRGIDDVAAVETADITDFLAGLREGDSEHAALSAGSAARTVVAVRGFHQFAVREQLTGDNPAATVKPPGAARRLPKALPLAQIEAILEASGGDGTALALRDRALLEVLYGVGARISETVGLDLDDLNLAESVVRLNGKGGRSRIVPVGSYARDACDHYLVRVRPQLVTVGKGTAAVFLNARGGRLSRQSAWAVLGKAAQRAGITSAVSPHTLRHSFATHLLDGGADVRVVQELLGHASVTTTQIYTLVTVDKLREVYATSHPRALG
ncbi:MAG: site-specific tyrosine recombinase XerD [Nocardioidaceae bacterium]|nr:site-specific tyrosine recombinase XerD [Nocardioidaceae bacterium]